MSATRPPGASDDLPSGDRLWQILHEGAEETETAPAAPPVPTPPSAPTSSPADAPSYPVVAPSEPDSSRIQRLINAPELMEPDFDYRTLSAPAHTEDFDSALRHYYRETGILIKCRNHPQTEATTQCPECQAYYCQDCIILRRGKLLCRDCAVALFVPTEEQAIAQQSAGADGEGAEITPEEHPEFQIGGTLFGVEGQPAHPLKQLLALALDLLLTRGVTLAAIYVLGLFNTNNNLPLFQIFTATDSGEMTTAVLRAAFLLQPVLPWLVLFAGVDYLYYFLTLSLGNRTFGMSWVGCRVVTEWGDFVSFSAVMLRTLVFMVCLGWPALLLSWFFPAFRGPHDYAGGTLVINYAGVKRVDAYETVQIKL
jgi:uncharacterized RDD family membrane protein YckC